MVTGSTKPKAAPKAAPKKASKAKTAATSKAASRPKAAPKPKKTGVKAKTVKKTAAAVKAPAARKVGEMVYNDELFESLAEAVLLAEAEMEGMLPDAKGQLFDYDIYMVSFLSDEEIGEAAKYIAGNGKGTLSEDALKPKLLAIRDNARVFVRVAEAHNSVRAFIDRVVASEGPDKLKQAFTGGEFVLREVGPDTFESFLLLF